MLGFNPRPLRLRRAVHCIIVLIIYSLRHFAYVSSIVLYWLIVLYLLMSDSQKRGTCSHIMAVADPHTRCARCRTCDIIDKPCSVCCGLTTEQRNAAVKARASRLRRLSRRNERAASADSFLSRHSSVGSDSQPIPAPSVSGQEGREGAGVPLEVVVNVTTGPRDSTAVTQTEPRTDSVADKRPLAKASE